MVSQFWLDTMTGLVPLYGISEAGLLLIISILFSLSFAIIGGMTTRNKDMALGVFFLSLLLFTILGLIDWYVITIPIVLVAAFVMHRMGGGQHT